MVHRLESLAKNRPAVEVSLRQTGELDQRAGRNPERTIARYVERAFDRLDIPYRIVYDLPVEIDAPPVGAGKETALRWWRSALNGARVSDTGVDANLLLTAANGGGLSAVGGWAGIAPAGTLTDEYELVDACSPSDPQHVVYGTLHELAHCLGSSHDIPWGRAWIDHERREFHRTPEFHPAKRNACGEYVPPRPDGYARVDHLWFSECTGRQLRAQFAKGGTGKKKRRPPRRRPKQSRISAPWLARTIRQATTDRRRTRSNRP